MVLCKDQTKRVPSWQCPSLCGASALCQDLFKQVPSLWFVPESGPAKSRSTRSVPGSTVVGYQRACGLPPASASVDTDRPRVLPRSPAVPLLVQLYVYSHCQGSPVLSFLLVLVFVSSSSVRFHQSSARPRLGVGSDSQGCESCNDQPV